MYIRRILQRRDAASVVVAIILAMLALNALSTFTFDMTGSLVELLGGSDTPSFGDNNWQDTYLAPLVSLFLQLVLLELALRVLVPVRVALVRKK